ncbi:unnamed protein product [Mortierella alpina]
MEPESAVHTVFATPELALLLFAYLRPHDLTKCIRVCKQWAYQAVPALWRDFSPGLSSTAIAGLSRNLPYIRNVELDLQNRALLQDLAHEMFGGLASGDTATDPSTSCTHLRQLKIGCCRPKLEDWRGLNDVSGPVLPNIVSILIHNLCLTHLTLPFPDVKVGDPLLNAIAKLNHLEYLAIDNFGSWILKAGSISLLLHTCLRLPKLTELYIHVEAPLSASDLKAPDAWFLLPAPIIRNAAVFRSHQTPRLGKLKGLQLPLWSDDPGRSLAWPLLRSDCLDLESCTVFPVLECLQPNQIARIVRTCLPNLKHLRYPYRIPCHRDLQVVAAFIHGCNGLRSFASPRFCEPGNRFAQNSKEWQFVIPFLLEHQGDTLEDFKLEGCQELPSLDQQAILTRCKQLKRYHVTACPYFGDIGFNVGVVLEEDWVCTELREIRMTPVGGSAHSPSDARRFYQQLGRLKKLEQLALDVSPRKRVASDLWDHTGDLTLSKGWLGELTGLKKLRSLSLEAEFSMGIGQLRSLCKITQSFKNSPVAGPTPHDRANLPPIPGHPAPNLGDSSFTITLLERNPLLTHLTLPFPDVKPDDPILAVISNLKRLRYLAVHSNGSSLIATRSISLLLRACLPLPKLTELRINSRLYWVDRINDKNVPDIETIIKEAAVARFSQTPTPGKIKALGLPSRPENTANPLALPLLKSGLLDLESFRVPQFEGALYRNDFEQLVRESCPNLKHLRGSCSSGYRDSRRHLRAFIRGCSGLLSFAADNFYHQNYDSRNDTYQSRCLISDLVSHHRDTLEVFELKNCDQVASGDLQQVLSQCKRLRRFHVSAKFPDSRYIHHQDGDPGFTVRDALNGDWVCTELRELWRTLGRKSTFHQADLYQQIGRLKQLEQLILDINRRRDPQLIDWEDERCFEINKDMLGGMAGLKNLRSLRMSSCFCSEMRGPEVRFMHEHWPLLSEIIILGSDVSNLRTKKHWRWLLSKRPHLSFSTVEIHQMAVVLHYL